ncbi:MAG: 1-acyl-sn-glycerol-3-phosphate acyltransferase [Candidatus Marinimicrobia bacterium]|nr:1-acyl-sn-glycerol-3-phosphate acyltransferase [Candidatus Neomarinimicrobiota bacterium]
MPVTGPCFVIGYHAHTYDAFMANLWMHDEPTAGIITEEYFRGGLVTWALRNVGSVKTRKYQPQSTPVRQILRLIKDNRMFVIMPEGERNWDGITRPTVASTGKLFRRLGVPVHPFIVHNGYKAWPRWAHWPRRIQVTVEFKQPFIFEPGMTDEEVARRVDEAVLWTPDQDMPEYPATATNGFRPADGITKLIFRCPDCADDQQLRTSRGRYLHCDSCGTSWKVGGDSYLTNIATGDSISSTAAYHKICAMPRKLRKWEQFGEAYLLARDLPVYFEEEFPAQKKLGRFDCLLRAD